MLARFSVLALALGSPGLAFQAPPPPLPPFVQIEGSPVGEPREPQVLFRLAQVSLSQGDAAQSEQLARRALTYANGRPDLQAQLWNTIAQAREKQGDSAGAALARQKARVNL